MASVVEGSMVYKNWLKYPCISISLFNDESAPYGLFIVSAYACIFHALFIYGIALSSLNVVNRLQN